MKSDTLENFQKSIKAIQVSLKSDKKTGTLHGKH